MKKLSVCLLLIAVLAGMCVSAYAEVNKDHKIFNVGLLKGDEYTWSMMADVYGFEEKDNITLKKGLLKEPSNELINKISAYKGEDEEVFFIELTAFDTEKNSKIALSDKVDMEIHLRESPASGLLECLGKDYKVLLTGETVKECKITDSSILDVTFESDELGIFAVIYNPNAIPIFFMLDRETEYASVKDCSLKTIVPFPEVPQKDGYRFAGWYERENGQGMRAYPGMNVSSLYFNQVYAYWVEDDAEYSDSSAKVKSVSFNDEIVCEMEDNKYIYFIPEAKDMSSITAKVKCENPNAYAFFGYSIDNQGYIRPHEYTDKYDDIDNSYTVDECRLVVKVISLDAKNSAVYSFIFGEERPITQIQSIDDDEHLPTLQADISGAKSFMVGIRCEDAALKIGEIANPDSTLTEAANKLALDGDTVKFFDLYACVDDKFVNLDEMVNVKVNLYRALSEQMGERYAVYRIEDGEFIPQNILSSTASNVCFEADKAGRFALIYGDEVYSVKFISDGEEYKKYDNLKLDAEIVIPEQPLKSGYTFLGWFTGENGMGEKLENGTAVSDNAVYYAYWQKNSAGGGGGGTTRYTVKFETDGGNKVASQTVARNAKASEPTAPTKDGYVFDGWYSDSKFKHEYDFDAKVTKNVTLYAKWIAEAKDEWQNLFTDVSEKDWFFENVKFVTQSGLMNGTSETEFAPNLTVTRGMLVTILYRLAGEPPVNKSVPFADVNADSYYANAVVWAKQNGIVSGVSENEFAPDAEITREQIAAIIYRYAKYKGYDLSAGENTNILSYADSGEISEYAIEAVQYAVGSGLIYGKTETTLNPKDSATRAELAAIMQRFIENKE